MEGFKILFIFIFTVVLFEVRGEGCTEDLTSKSAALRLSNNLLCSYNKNVRPVMNQSTQTNVNITFYFHDIFMDDKWEVVTIGFQLVMNWKDEFLTWDPSKYDNIKQVFEFSTLIWTPDIMAYNIGLRGTDTNDISYFLPESMVRINSDGLVYYNHYVTLNAHCSTNIAKWPFDSHNCSFLIGSPLYTNNYVNYSFPTESTYFSLYNPNREWSLKNIHGDCLNIYYYKQNFTHCILQYTLNLERFSSMYFSTVIIPAVVISLMRTFTFLMSRENSLRITLLCLFFISELLYIQFLDMKIPNNGEHSVYIVLLYRNSLMLTAVALIMNVISNELYKRSVEDFPRNGPEWAKNLMQFLLNKKLISVLTNFNTQGAELLIENNVEEDTPNSQRDEKALFWKTLSILLDRLSFLIILILSLINFLFLIP